MTKKLKKKKITGLKTLSSKDIAVDLARQYIKIDHELLEHMPTTIVSELIYILARHIILTSKSKKKATKKK